MMQHHSLRRIRCSARSYAVFLYLYPPSFRRAFGAAMGEIFEQSMKDEVVAYGARGILSIWRIVLAELLPSLLREHADALNSLVRGCAIRQRLVRVLIALLVPGGAYLMSLHYMIRPVDVFMDSASFLLMALGIMWAKGSGWLCSRNAVVGFMAGIGTPLVWEGLFGNTLPGFVGSAALLLATAATIGFILSIWVRLILEDFDPGVFMPIFRRFAVSNLT